MRPGPVMTGEVEPCHLCLSVSVGSWAVRPALSTEDVTADREGGPGRHSAPPCSLSLSQPEK